jgi:hypothetical protein
MKAILTRLTWGPKGISGYNENGFQFRLEQPWMIELMNLAIVQGLVSIDQEKKKRETYKGEANGSTL